MFAYCGNDPVGRTDPTGRLFVALPLLNGVVQEKESPPYDGPLAAEANLEVIKNLSDDMYNCYGFAIGKAIYRDPTGYKIGDDVESVFRCVQADLGPENCKRLSSIDEPIGAAWYRVALRCSETDYHFVRQQGSIWYSKSERLPVYSVSISEVTNIIWFAIQSDALNSRYCYDRSYDGDIIYFAIRKGWSN